MRTWLFKNLLVILIIFLVSLIGVTSIEAAKTIPSGPDPIRVTSDAIAVSNDLFSQYTSLEFARSTGNLSLPLSLDTLDPNTQSNAIGYHESGQSFGGESNYNGYLNLDTGNNPSTGQNLETLRSLSYNANEGGRLSFREDVSSTDVAYSDLAEVSLCPEDIEKTPEVATNDEKASFSGSVEGSNVSISSFSGTKAFSDSGAPVEMTYGIKAQGNGGNSGKGVGNAKAEAHVSKISGTGETTTILTYDDITEVSGLFELSKVFSYTS